MDPVRERELALAVHRSKQTLQALLSPEERRSKHGARLDNPRRDDGGVVWTFEDSAALLAQESREVKDALRKYQEAINAFWLYLLSCEVPEKLYSMWRRKHRHIATLVPREDVEAEIVFRLRDAIRRFNPTAGAPFLGYVPSVLYGDLLEWVRGQVTVVVRPRDAVLRKETPPADTGLASESSRGAYAPDLDVLIELIDEDREDA